MIGRTNAAGGAALNYKVIGGTSAPSNPSENTIWVNTGTEVTSHDFCPDAPNPRSGQKNLIPYPFDDTSMTINGITYTDTGDGKITANGTATAAAYFTLLDASSTRAIILEPGTYTLSGGVASCGVSIRGSADNFKTNVISRDSYANPVTFTVSQTIKARFFIVVPSGRTLTNAVIRPQLERGSAATAFVKGSAEGQVWIRTGSAGVVSFNALKKDNITIFPALAKQHVSGAWAEKTAKIYQGGQWVDWTYYLYNTGDTCDSRSGGWTSAADSTGVCTMYDNYMYLGYTGSAGRAVAAYTVNKINTTGKTTLYVDADVTDVVSGYGFYIGVSNQKTSYHYADALATTKCTTTGRQTISFDLTSYQGQYYIMVASSVSKINVYRVWVE